MQAVLSHLIEHLKDLKRQGVATITYEPESLDALKRQLIESMATHQEPELKPIQPALELNDVSEPKLVKKRGSAAQLDATIPAPVTFAIPEGEKRAQWEWLKERVLNCSVCKNHLKPGKQVVFGVGNIDADIFFCGEAPGAEEEMQGEPFVGPAGQLLTKIIGAMGLQRKEVYIGNIMNWRPQLTTDYGNRPPTEQEIEFCLPYLKAQLKIIQPEVIVALGATAVNGLLGYDAKRKMSDCRGTWLTFEGYPLMATFHPSYLLRNNTNRSKRMVWEDMLKVMEKLSFSISEKQKNYFSEINT